MQIRTPPEFRDGRAVERRRGGVDRAGLGQWKQPLYEIVYVFELVKVPALNFGEQPAAMIGSLARVESEKGVGRHAAFMVRRGLIIKAR